MDNICILESRTATTVVNSAGDRLLLHRPGASATAFEGPIDFSLPLTAGLSYFHFANFYALPRLRTRAAENVRAARAANLTISVDTRWDSQLGNGGCLVLCAGIEFSAPAYGATEGLRSYDETVAWMSAAKLTGLSRLRSSSSFCGPLRM